MDLRYYQKAAIDALWDHLNDYRDNPCIVIPTAGGKSPVMGEVARTVVEDFGGRVMILAHVKELLEQNREACLDVEPKLNNRIGLYSAGLKLKETKDDIIVAGIQSAYRDATIFGKRDLIIIDEAHLIAPKAEGMYMRFLKDAYRVNPKMRVVGLTATPYRMRGGDICKPDNMLNQVCYEVGVKELIDKGFLCPLITKATAKPMDFSKVRLVSGDFAKNEVSDMMDNDDVVRFSCEEIAAMTQDRNSVLVFCASVDHSHHVANMLRALTQAEVGEVYGETTSEERRTTLARFKGGTIKYLCNVGVLTTGFNAPNTDCVVLLMPTRSPGKYYQCVGRGFRLHESKTDTLILDYGGNIMRHGPVDAIQVSAPKEGSGEAPAKTCPECNTVCHMSLRKCPDCGFEFPIEEKAPHDSQASTEAIISGEVVDTEYDVDHVMYHVHKKKGYTPGDPRTVRVEYFIPLGYCEKEWLCPEHNGYARDKFVKWWRQACIDEECVPPTNADHVIQAWEMGLIRDPGGITLRNVSGNKYSEICSRDWSKETRAASRKKLMKPAVAADKEDDCFEPPVTNAGGGYLSDTFGDDIPF